MLSATFASALRAASSAAAGSRLSAAAFLAPALAAVLAFGLVSAAASSPAAAQELRIGVEGAFPPFSEKTPEGALTGFDIEIAEALCHELGRTCVLIEQDWDGIIPALNARKYDAIVASMSITEERKRVVDFTERYYYSPAALIAPSGSPLKASRKGTERRVIGVQRATVQECYHAKHFPDSELRQYGTLEEALLDMIAGRVDGVLVDVFPALEWVEDPKNHGNYEMIATDLYDEDCFGEGIGIAVRQGDDELREALNGAIRAIRANGVYQRINDRYFSVDIYGAGS